jgi:hypothetical protein
MLEIQTIIAYAAKALRRRMTRPNRTRHDMGTKILHERLHKWINRDRMFSGLLTSSLRGQIDGVRRLPLRSPDLKMNLHHKAKVFG